MKNNKVTPRILSGFMELLPEDQILFNGMLDTIRSVYERFGFTPIETPAIELTEILLAKGGGETDQQIYRFTKGDNDLSLHFDLTVPLARYVAQYYGELTFPFRRYQMQKVWRAERAQKGRFREFYQCDIDVIGSKNVLIDAEIPSVIYSVFKALGFDNFTIRINNRKVLNGFLKATGVEDLSKEVLRAIDKIEKQGKDAVTEEMKDAGISDEKIAKIFQFISIKGTNDEILKQLDSLGIDEELFKEGVRELGIVSNSIVKFGVPVENHAIDLTIARGLDYYTGTVYETVLNDYPGIGSVCSGGRFDDLAKYYTDNDLPGVGISIGLTRLFYKLKEAGLIKSGQATPSRVLITQIDENLLGRYIEVATELRENGINTEIYFESGKIAKQFKYADKLAIPFAIVIGENESRESKVSLKNMSTGDQSVISIAEAIKRIKNDTQEVV